jgi:hypothetical protein
MEEEENSKLCSASCTLSPALNLLLIMTIEREVDTKYWVQLMLVHGSGRRTPTMGY